MSEYLFLTPDEIFELTYELGKRIKESGFEPNCLVGISRGGLWIVRILSDFFDIKDLHTVRVVYYEDIEATKRKPMLVQDVNGDLLKDKRVLIVDDVSDTGDSLGFTVKLMRQKGIENFKTATLHYKPWSKFKPDFFIEETEKWIIYPWEIGETIRSILNKDMSWDEKMNELRKTGIPKKMIKTYVSESG
jgi:hypothetical protein